MGVWHLVSLIDANRNLMTALPKAVPPSLEIDDHVRRGSIAASNSDDVHDLDGKVVEGLSWCEERLLAINEVMMLENSKQTGLSDSLDPALVLDLPLFQRQSILANAVIDATAKKTNRRKSGNFGKFLRSLE